MSMRIVITGGAGFIGSHMAVYFAQRGDHVIVLDNLSREKLLGKRSNQSLSNWRFLESIPNVKLVRGDVCDRTVLDTCFPGVDLVIHAAAQTAVTSSLTQPGDDFHSNALGTFCVLEAARRHGIGIVLYCSTNKVYGDRVNSIRVGERDTRYTFPDSHLAGIPETFGIDLCEHTPYGCSKLTGDLYMQDYARIYGIRTGVFRMSCIYGERQMGVEDQGWMAWFTIATLTGCPITIYGDGKQVRDVLYVADLVDLFDRFISSKEQHVLLNIGGGPRFTLSLLELLSMLEEETGLKSPLTFSAWRPSDQKVYISDIREAKAILGWEPQVPPREGVQRLVHWTRDNLSLFSER